VSQFTLWCIFHFCVSIFGIRNEKRTQYKVHALVDFVIFHFFVGVSFFGLEHKITHLAPTQSTCCKSSLVFFKGKIKAQKTPPQNAFSKIIPFNIHFHFEQ
jgi:hypothetical protein